MRLTAERIARIAHEVHIAIQLAEPDVIPDVYFSELSVEEQKSRIAAVDRLIKNPSMSAVDHHERWRKAKMMQGYTWGPHINELTKKHPDLIPHRHLTTASRIKLNVFLALVKSLSKTS